MLVKAYPNSIPVNNLRVLVLSIFKNRCIVPSRIKGIKKTIEKNGFILILTDSHKKTPTATPKHLEQSGKVLLKILYVLFGFLLQIGN